MSGHFRQTSADRVADPALADKLYAATTTSLDKMKHLAAENPDWESLRERARQIKRHTLTHLDEYLDSFVKTATANGAKVHWAHKAEDACKWVVDIAQEHGVKRVTKAKSMTSEEIELNKALLAAGIEPFETDLGEMICQLAGEPPSHVTAPIIHMSMEEIARLLHQKGVIESIPEFLKTDEHAPDRAPVSNETRVAAAAAMVAKARAWLRERFLTADMGISGANFLVAESGTLVLVENEANIRLSTSLPPLHVAVVGIEKLIPKFSDLGTFLSLLPVAATGQRQSGYVSLISQPYGELHIILLDNGRSRLLLDEQHWDLLSCIRCGACMNVCPVYRQVSGHGYESVYPGPIGAVLMPHLRDEPQFKELPFASSLCHACAEVCPVKIPLPQRLLEWRDRIVRSHGRPRFEATAFAAWSWLMRHPGLYHGARPPVSIMNAMTSFFGAAKDWSATRDLPPIAEETFTAWWKKNRA